MRTQLVFPNDFFRKHATKKTGTNIDIVFFYAPCRAYGLKTYACKVEKNEAGKYKSYMYYLLDF